MLLSVAIYMQNTKKGFVRTSIIGQPTSGVWLLGNKGGSGAVWKGQTSGPGSAAGVV